MAAGGAPGGEFQRYELQVTRGAAGIYKRGDYPKPSHPATEPDRTPEHISRHRKAKSQSVKNWLSSYCRKAVNALCGGAIQLALRDQGPREPNCLAQGR